MQAFDHRPGVNLGIRLLHPREQKSDGVALLFHFLKLARQLIVHGVSHQRYTSLRYLDPIANGVRQPRADFVRMHVGDCFAALAMTANGWASGGWSQNTCSIPYSAASFSPACAAFSSAAFASTSSTMCSTMSAPAIVWSVLPAA